MKPVVNDGKPGKGADMVESFVLAPGLNCTRRLFEPQIAALGRNREIVLADHARDDDMAAIARRLLAGTPERFALAGLSMGGYLALEVIRQAPERVTRLALLDTNARADTDEQRRNREREIALAEGGRFREACDARWEKSVHPDRLADPELRRTYDLMAEETGPAVFVRQLRAIMSRRDSRPMLPEIGVPTLILVGDADALTPPTQAQEMAALIPGATLVMVTACGHLSTLERPQAVTDALAAWLEA
jgi:pimeloyl-ACP methyl ester carboxylesterase